MSHNLLRNLRPIVFAMVTAAAVVLPLRSASAQVTGKEVVSVKGVKSRGATADPNVKSDSLPANHANATMPAPPAKGGPKTRGATTGVLHVDNRTLWVIRIYVDGDYVGTVSPYGDSYGYYGCSVRRLYARAVFDDGSYYSWGPSSRDVCDNFTWRLNP
ncbi:MAG TPA: hypothetical protein VH762_12215 [Gemmatimonadaceae bacterium]|jgi:hypothetical protein